MADGNKVKRDMIGTMKEKGGILVGVDLVRIPWNWKPVPTKMSPLGNDC